MPEVPELKRTSPPMSTEFNRLGFTATCDWCGWKTPRRVSTAGQIAGIAAEHGRVLPEFDNSSLPACPQALAVPR
jgi:hypothetical protein